MFCLSGQKGRDAMKTDSRIGGGTSAHVYRHPLLSCISVFLACLADVVDPSAKRRVRWTPQAASTAAVLMALDADPALTERFRHARACMKVDYRRRRRTPSTYNGLMKALERQQDTILPLVKTEMRCHVRRRLHYVDPTGPWLLLAVDGSKEDLPRTPDHERVFGIADNGVFPQAFITAMVEVHTGLLWDWRIDRARASEKKHLMEMTPEIPNDALLLADGAFVGLPIWEKLCAQGKHFLIRVGGNVHLIANLWPQAKIRQRRDIVYVWPIQARRHHPPLRLRLIKVGSGVKAVYLLTNVLDSRRLSRKAAGMIYRKRWGVELFYRTLKRTLNCAKLRSKAARRAKIELEWTLVALTIVTLLGIDALVKRRRDPRRLSPAQLLRALREAMHHGTPSPQGRVALDRALGNSLKDTYHRPSAKQSRHRTTTRNTPEKRLKPPIVRNATAKERNDAVRYWLKTAA
jgi:hypothetical protein